MKKTVGILLAGGLSRRFGSPKAFARLDGKYFYERAMDALEPLCEKIVIVTLPELKDRFPGQLEVITDLPDVAGCGPLAGILSAMDYIEAERYIVLSCDMPYVNHHVIGKLVQLHDADVTAVNVSGRFQPLVSIWNLALKESLKTALENKQYKVMKLLDQFEVAWINGSELTVDEQHVFTNVNTPTDLGRG